METLASPDRVYAIGDVHGHADRLRALHDLIARDLAETPAERPILVHLGDYIDRGPQSAACLDILLDHDLPMPAVNLRGNHEQMLLDTLAEPDRALLWLQNGGAATLESWAISLTTPPNRWREQIPPRHLELLERLVLSYQTDTHLFVHAGVRPGIKLTMQDPADLLWIRTSFLEWNGTMLPDMPHLKIVHGHTPAEEVQLRRNRIGVDTNAGHGGKLTCAAITANSVYFLQV